MRKRRVNVTLDGDLVDLHKLKSNVPLSTDINNYLQESLLASDELEEVNSKIELYETKLRMLRPKQARLEQLKIQEINNQNNYAACHDTLLRMCEAKGGVIGKNQLRGLADVRKLDYNRLVEYCLENDFSIVETAQPGGKKHSWR